MEVSMNDPLGTLFDQFLKERLYLKAVTPKTLTWYQYSPIAANISAATPNTPSTNASKRSRARGRRAFPRRL